MDRELADLLEATRGRRMTPPEREEQVRNFAAGNVGMENPQVTRAVVDEAERRLEMRAR